MDVGVNENEIYKFAKVSYGNLSKEVENKNWFGYKDISNHFKDADGELAFTQGLAATKGFFTGKQAKIWNYSTNNLYSKPGLLLNNSAITTNETAFSNYGGMDMKIYSQASAGGIDFTGTIKLYGVQDS